MAKLTALSRPSPRYDFVVNIEDEFVRIQVKTGRVQDENVVFNCSSTKSNTKECRDEPYRSDEIDGFAVYCPENDGYYWVPVEETGNYEKWLRVEEANHPNSNINWAEDYELAERFASAHG
ncbi:group I intron-associated PD-(D/E)XK endonuclease [Halorubrum sp. BOL3-1]|uniref:group I intron-associated PD-(D/E)XK endonuclease n=1 Tax=Halorubrum sp. BOL3-1 TaxID=2497325 RepID=UPI00140A03AC|nr:group I intron-associated PD-(D/E)XK endonuclease [Halorubrum sp. BOL3-1]